MKIIAHRCGPTIYPEQTITSAKYALECRADMIEIDVRFTKDKKLAVSHDANAQRVYGTDKPICDMDCTEFLSLRHKDNRQYPSHIFEDFLKENVFPLLVHIKEDETIDTLVKTIEEYNCTKKVVLGIGNPDMIRHIKELNADIEVLAFMPAIDKIEQSAKMGADYIRLWEKWMNDETVLRVKNTGAKLWIMVDGLGCGATTKEAIEKIKEYEADGILINDVTFPTQQ